MNNLINGLLIGTIIGLMGGFIVAVKAGAGGVTNEIGKVKTKGDNSPIDTELIQESKQKRGIFRKIFKRKKDGANY
jgi:hypothetical protein